MNCDGVTGKGNVGTPECTEGDATPEAPSDMGLLMPEVTQLLNCGDLGAEIAALAILSGHDQRKIAKQIRDVEENALAAAEKNELVAMAEKAEHARNAAFIAGFSTSAAGIITMGSAGCSAGGKAVKAEAPATGAVKAEGLATEAVALKPQAQSVQPKIDLATLMKGSATLVEGGGKASSAFAQSAADRADRERVRQDQISSRQKRALEDTREMEAAAKKHMEKIIDLYKEYSGAKQEASRAALFRA